MGTIVNGWRIVQHLYPRIVFRETFTGDGNTKTFQLDGTIGNGDFVHGSWSVSRVETALPAHATKTTGGTLWDSLLPLVRNRVQVSSINSSGLATLSYAPRNEVEFYIWYWYELRAGTKIDDYYREDFIAKMESDAGASLASQVTVDTTSLTGNLSGVTGDGQSMFEAIDSLTIAGSWTHYDKTLSSDTFAASGQGIYTLTSESGVTDNLDAQITGLSAWDEIVIFAATGHTITVKDGTYIKCKYDFALTGYDCATLLCVDGSVCVVKGGKQDNQ